MKVLIILASYRPGIADQVVYGHRLANGLRELGHAVTLLVSDRERAPSAEAGGELRVVVAPTLVQVGTLMWLPTLNFLAARLIAEHDAVNLHVPQWGAAGSAAWCRATRTPLVLTYHRDPGRPRGLFSGLATVGVRLGNRTAGLLADRVVCDTADLAATSPLLRSGSGKIEVIPPPAEVAEIGEGAVAAFRKMHRLDEARPVIGMAGRLAVDSGVDVLLNALPRVLEQYPGGRVLFAGQYWDVKGEEMYARRLAPLFREHEDRWSFLGVLRPVQMAAFYRSLDVIVAPSLNAAGSVGLAQIEAMLCGTPSIASDLPGVRQPVEQSGMGKVVPAGDGEALAEAIVDLMDHRDEYVRPREEISERWSTRWTAAEYEALFKRLVNQSS